MNWLLTTKQRIADCLQKLDHCPISIPTIQMMLSGYSTIGTKLRSKIVSKANLGGVENFIGLTTISSFIDGANMSGYVDLSMFVVTNKCKSVERAFAINNNMTSLDISGWDLSGVTNSKNIFYATNNLSSIIAIGCNDDTVSKLRSWKSSATIVTE